MRLKILKTQSFTLLEVLIASTLFTMMALIVMETFEGTKKNIDEMVDREEVFANGVKVLSEIQDAVHQAAEIYNHVPTSAANDSESNLFYLAIDWSQLPLRMGTNLNYDNRLPDFTGQTTAINNWKNANLSDTYALSFHINDLLLSLPPSNGPGVPVGTRGYAGNVLFIAKHLLPIEVVLSPTDSTFAMATANPESHMYGQSTQKGNQILYYTGGDPIPGIERMYSVDVIRFEIYYLTEQVGGKWKKLVSTTDTNKYREHSLRLVKAESIPYLVYDKFSNLKRNLDISYHSGDPIPPSVVPNPNPNDFPTVFKALNSATTGVSFESISKNYTRSVLTKTIEYVDNATGPVIRNLTLLGADGFSSNPIVGEKITFTNEFYEVFLTNSGMSRDVNLSVGYNTNWTTGQTLGMEKSKNIPWFAQQPELMSVTPVSEFFPSGFEISGSGFGANQRIGVRLCLWLRTTSQASSYSHFVVAARAQ
jgi:type II secretory pathway pseudopilin PulG